MRAPQKLAIAILSISLVSLPVIQTNAAVKAGTSCTKVGQVKKSKGSNFICTKQGKKLAWKKQDSAAPSPTPTPSPTPSTTATPQPTPTAKTEPTPSPSQSSSQTKIDDQVNFKSFISYGIEEGRLIRKSTAGTFFSSDSRELDEFDPIRRAAYAAINSRALSPGHPKVELEYVTRPSFPNFLLPFIESELKNAASLWNDIFEERIKVKVYLVTEQDREYIKSVRWLQLNLPDKFDRFDRRNERVFISGGGAFWNVDGNGSEGRIYLATASYLDTSLATNEWPQVARHEFVHVVQDYMFRKSGRERPSSESDFDKLQHNNFREGSANTISFHTSFSNIGWASDALDARLSQIAKYTKDWKLIKTESDVIAAMRATESRTPEGAFEMAYPLGSLMYEWFIATYGMEGYIKLLRQLATAPNFDDAILRAVGITKDTFYSLAAPYVLSVIKRTNPYE